MSRRKVKKQDPFKGPYKYHPHTGQKAPWGSAWFWIEAGTPISCGRDPIFTIASDWLMGPYSGEWGMEFHPETGQKAPDGKMWAKNLMGGYFLESIGAMYTTSPASETYWSQ